MRPDFVMQSHSAPLGLSFAQPGSVAPFAEGAFTGFQADGKTMGRPVGVTVDPKGALIVADDLSNTVWRVTPAL